MFFLVWIESCDDCADCDPIITESAISLVFINDDSLSILDKSNDSLNFVDDSLSNIEMQLTMSLNTNTESLMALQIGIDSGNNELQSTFDSILLEMTVDSVELNSIVAVLVNLDTKIDSIEAIKTRINNGEVLVDSVVNLANGNSIKYEDSASQYSIPLNFNDTISEYQIVLGGNEYRLSLTHENITSVDTRRNIIIEILNFKVIDHQFDSIAPVKCLTEDCSVQDETLTCYF